MSELPNLAENVKRLRAAKGWTQEELADEAGIDTSTLRKIEQGRTERSRTSPKIAEALGVEDYVLYMPPPLESVEIRQVITELGDEGASEGDIEEAVIRQGAAFGLASDGIAELGGWARATFKYRGLDEGAIANEAKAIARKRRTVDLASPRESTLSEGMTYLDEPPKR